VFFTGFYTFRMVFLTFHGEPRTETAENAHGVGWNVKFPLVVLGVLATVAGLVNMVPIKVLSGADIDFLHGWLDGGTEAVTAHHYGSLLHDVAGYTAGTVGGSETTTVALSAGLSLGLALAGSGLAYSLYSGSRPEEYTARLGPVRDLWYANYYQDEYQVWLASGLTLPLARAADRFDQGVIDGVVDGVSSVSLFSSGWVKRIQTGVVTNYAALLVLGLITLVVALGVYGGWFV
jgi:NADH-quinone oxidoreductase subunit L